MISLSHVIFVILTPILTATTTCVLNGFKQELLRKSARGGSQDAKPFLLRGDRVDICLEEATLKGRSECLQALLETYYGSNFTVLCPFLPLRLAELKCRGCPWDKVNASKINPTLANELKRSELFHDASDSCCIATHLVRYSDPYFVRQQVSGFGILGTVVLLVVTAYFTASSSLEQTRENGAILLGFNLPEPVFLYLLFVLYHTGSLGLIASEDYIEFCEGEADKLFQELVRISAYAALLLISLSRCRGLRTANVARPVQSWELYIHSDIDGRRNRSLIFIMRFVVPVILMALFLSESTLSTTFMAKSRYQKNLCYTGERNKTLFGMQVTKVLLEMFVVTVYAFGPSRRKFLFYLRYSLLTAGFLTSVVLFILTLSGFESSEIGYMMVSRIADAKIAFPVMNLAHTICVSLLGILEPLRLGWPARPIPH